MPWRNSSIMDQRLLFIADYRRHVFSLAELCRRFDISRPTAYNMDYAVRGGRPEWLARSCAPAPSVARCDPGPCR